MTSLWYPIGNFGSGLFRVYVGLEQVYAEERRVQQCENLVMQVRRAER